MKQHLRHLATLIAILALSIGYTVPVNAAPAMVLTDGGAEDRQQDDKDGESSDDQQDDEDSGDDQQGGDQQQRMITKTWKLTLNGTVPPGETFAAAYVDKGATGTEASFVLFCGELESAGTADDCVGGGTVYIKTVRIPAGTTVQFVWVRLNETDKESQVFYRGEETLNADLTNTASFTFGGAGDDQQDDDRGGGDDQQDDGGAEDDQQGGDDQQTEMVTKTFKLTLYGDVPEGESFTLGLFSELKYNQGEGVLLVFCTPESDEFPDAEPCVGGGATYTLSVQLPRGDTLRSTFYRGLGPGARFEAFHTRTETLYDDATNTAWYSFDEAGDDQQQDDRQDELPEMPNTGAGGIAGGVPLGEIAVVLSCFGLAGFGKLRRR